MKPSPEKSRKLFYRQTLVSRVSVSIQHPSVMAAYLQRFKIPACIQPTRLDTILWSDLVRVHPGRPAALPTATGWDDKLRARSAGVRLPAWALRVIIQNGSILMSDHAPPPVLIGNG